jgi:hypothetical protein
MNGTIGLRSKNAVVQPMQPAPRLRTDAPIDDFRIYEEVRMEPEAPKVPPSWTKGQLLNVRNRGEFYVVTLLGEEDEPPLKPAPSGALRFTNTPLCQAFVSAWYARESFDPRAR